MNAIYKYHDNITTIKDLFSDELQELHAAEKDLKKGVNLIAVAIALTCLGMMAVYGFEQVKLKTVVSHYQAQLLQNQQLLRSVQEQQSTGQSNLDELGHERDVTINYVRSLQNQLAEVTAERDLALGSLPQKTVFDPTP